MILCLALFDLFTGNKKGRIPQDRPLVDLPIGCYVFPDSYRNQSSVIASTRKNKNVMPYQKSLSIIVFPPLD
jgi:hypothetical protein